jgi:hypothetical protein
MKYDDNRRSEFGLSICLRDMEDGTSRLFIDDVKADKDENPINWKYNSFFSFTPGFDNETLDNMSLTDEQFQNIGTAVVARLLALNGRVK